MYTYHNAVHSCAPARRRTRCTRKHRSVMHLYIYIHVTIRCYIAIYRAVFSILARVMTTRAQTPRYCVYYWRNDSNTVYTFMRPVTLGLFGLFRRCRVHFLSGSARCRSGRKVHNMLSIFWATPPQLTTAHHIMREAWGIMRRGRTIV